MRRSSVSSMILIALTTLVCQATAQTSSLVPTLTIVIYDYAHVPEKQLGAAEWEVSRVFHNAGVETHWVHCSTRPRHVVNALCTYLPEKVGLVVKILSRELRTSLHYNEDAYGAAIIFPEGNGVPVGYVF
jgi:hypothetical protein